LDNEIDQALFDYVNTDHLDADPRVEQAAYERFIECFERISQKYNINITGIRSDANKDGDAQS
jgi:hypothetical protein